MKNRAFGIIVFALLISNSTSVLAQFNFGVKGGLNYVNQRTIDSKDVFNPYSTPKWLPTFHVGGYGIHALTDRAALVWEVQYSDKGYKSSSGKNKQHLAYITTPILFRYNIIDKFSIEAGAEFGILLFTQRRDSDMVWNDEIYERLDLGIAGGIIYDIDERFSVGIRYIQGVANVLNKNYTITGYDEYGNSTTTNLRDEGLKFKNQMLQLSAGCRISKLKKG